MIGNAGKKLTITAFSALLAAMFALGGCSSAQPAASSASASSESTSSSSSVEEEAVEADIVIGDAGGDTSIVLANETGVAIDGLSIAPTGSEAAEDVIELMPAGQSWADGETAAVSFDQLGSGRYDIRLQSGEEAYVIHDFDADLIGEAAIQLADGFAYVTYEQFGVENSTLEAETAIYEEAQAAAAAEAEAAAAAEANYEEPAASSAPAQSSDSCIDGGVVLR